MRSRTRTGVRLVVGLFALVAMAMYAFVAKTPQSQHSTYTPKGLFGNVYARLFTSHTAKLVSPNPALLHQRHLLSLDGYSYNGNDPTTPPLGDDDDDNCTDPRGTHHGYNDSCVFVQDQCQDEAALVNYLSFVLCDLASLKVRLFLVSHFSLPLPPA